jgi:hypothetical protein
MDRGTDEEREGAALSQDHGVQPHARQELSMSDKPISALLPLEPDQRRSLASDPAPASKNYTFVCIPTIRNPTA